MCVLPNYPYISNTFLSLQSACQLRGKMKRIKPAPPFDELNNLVTFQRMSLSEICRMYDVNRYTLRKWMEGYNIRKPKRNIPTNDEMYDLYVNQHISYRGIAEMYGVSCYIVGAWMKAYGITARPSGAHPNKRHNVKFTVPPELAEALNL